jgi:hypothetical protein
VLLRPKTLRALSLHTENISHPLARWRPYVLIRRDGTKSYDQHGPQKSAALAGCNLLIKPSALALGVGGRSKQRALAKKTSDEDPCKNQCQGRPQMPDQKMRGLLVRTLDLKDGNS